MGTIETAARIGSEAGISDRSAPDRQDRDDHPQNSDRWCSGSELMVTEPYREFVADREPGIFSIFPDKYRFGCEIGGVDQSVASQFP
jgi:hypothetical protein